MTTFEVYVEMKWLGAALGELYSLRGSALPASEPLKTCNRAIAKLRSQVREVGTMIPINPCTHEGEFELRVMVLGWVKQVALDEEHDRNGKEGHSR